jgi:hypothetical protein
MARCGKDGALIDSFGRPGRLRLEPGHKRQLARTNHSIDG